MGMAQLQLINKALWEVCEMHAGSAEVFDHPQCLPFINCHVLKSVHGMERDEFGLNVRQIKSLDARV